MSSSIRARVVAAAASASLAALAALAACGVGSLTSAQAGSGNAATVRFVNASGATLDLATGGFVPTGNSGIAPGSGVGCFVVADAAAPGLSVRQTGTSADLSGFAPQLAAGGRYTLVAYPAAAGSIQFVAVPAAPLVATGRSALRIVQASAALGPVDVYVITAPGAALGAPVATGLGFGGVSAAVDVAAGSQQVRLTGTGTTAVVFDAGAQALAAGVGYSLVVSSATGPILVPDC